MRFFPEEIQSPDLFCLADSSGIPYNIEQKNKWSLSEFIQGTGQPPSKLRLYVMNVDEVIPIIVLL